MYQLNADESLISTPIQNNFIEHYMPLSNPIYSLIYIYLLKKCLNNENISKEALAKRFNILETDVNNALEYWKENKLINFSDTAIEFLPIITPDSPTLIASQRPDYSAEELRAYGEQEKIKDLYSYAQDKLGRMLRYSDLNFIFALYDWLRMSPELIKKLLDYCNENDHKNLTYIEAVAIDWSERGITTPAEADEYIFTFTKTYREILKALGRGGRTAAPKEVEYMENWLGTMPLDIVLEACDRTIMVTDKGVFKYADSIIKKWHDAGVKTIDDIIALDESFAKAKASEKKSSPQKQKKNKFSNFEGRKIDYSEIEKLEQQLLHDVTKPTE